jgi:hypothetical protein
LGVDKESRRAGKLPPLVEARTRAMAQFNGFCSRSSTVPVFLNGANAVILHREESYSLDEGIVGGYVLTLFLITPEGHHFLFMSKEAGNPFLKYLTPDRARTVISLSKGR